MMKRRFLTKNSSNSSDTVSNRHSEKESQRVVVKAYNPRVFTKDAAHLSKNPNILVVDPINIADNGMTNAVPAPVANPVTRVPGLFKPENGGVINFLVVNLISEISVDDINRVLTTLKTYSDTAFMPVWGITASFNLLPFGTFPTNDQIVGNSVIYLADKIINGSVNFAGAIAIHMMTAPAPNDTVNGDGPQPGTLILNAPKLPVGTPYAIVPYGEKTYGVQAGLSGGKTVLDVLAVGLSHEVFEIIKDPWPAGFGASYQSVINKTRADFYIKEICDPTEHGPQVSINGLIMTNFVYPDYFNPYAPPGTQFDYNGVIKAALTPYAGMQFGLTVDGIRGGMNMFVDVSTKSTPDVVKRYVAAKVYVPRSALNGTNGRSMAHGINAKDIRTLVENIKNTEGELRGQHLGFQIVPRPTRDDIVAESGTANFLALARLLSAQLL